MADGPIMNVEAKAGHRRWLLSLFAVILVVFALSGVFDRIGFGYTEQGVKRALLTFAMARGLNGVISVAQGTEVALQPAGVGVNFTPGQILDPVNDLVEWFSWVMLAAATSLGVQQLLLHIFSSTGFNLVFCVTVAVALATLWTPRLRETHYRVWAVRLLVATAVLRFAVPFVALGSEALYAGFMQERYQASTHSIEQATENISRINEGAAEEADDTTLLGSIKRMYESAVSSVDIQAYAERYQTAAADVSEQVVNIIVIFTIQTVLLPLLFLWLVLQLLKQAVRLRP